MCPSPVISRSPNFQQCYHLYRIYSNPLMLKSSSRIIKTPNISLPRCISNRERKRCQKLICQFTGIRIWFSSGIFVRCLKVLGSSSITVGNVRCSVSLWSTNRKSFKPMRIHRHVVQLFGKMRPDLLAATFMILWRMIPDH